MIHRAEELARQLNYESDVAFLTQRDPSLLHDDLSWAANGASFVTSPKNAFIAHGDRRVLDKAVASGEWADAMSHDSQGQLKLRVSAVDDYSQRGEDLRILITVLVHVTGGMMARGTEFMTIKKENTWASMRNIFALNNIWIMYLIEYSKTQNRSNAPRVIPRFLPSQVGMLLVSFLVDILPFEGYLWDTVGRARGAIPYLFANRDYTGYLAPIHSISL